MGGIWKATGAVILAFFLLALPARAVSYAEYLKLPEAEQRNLIRKFVREDGNGYSLVAATRYKVHSKMDQEFLLRWAIRMDDYYEKFSGIFVGPFKLRGQPELYIFPDLRSYREFVNSLGFSAGWSAGMYVQPKKLLLGQNSDGEAFLKLTLFHEGTHQLLHYYLGHENIPPWFNEGVACNFETWDENATLGENIQAGTLISQRRDQVCRTFDSPDFLGVEALFALDQRGWNSSENPGQNYAEAWAIINFFFNTDRGQKNFNKILKAISNGADLNKAIPKDARINLEKEWYADIRSRLIPYNRFIAPAFPSPLDQEMEKRWSEMLNRLGRDEIGGNVKGGDEGAERPDRPKGEEPAAGDPSAEDGSPGEEQEDLKGGKTTEDPGKDGGEQEPGSKKKNFRLHLHRELTFEKKLDLLDRGQKEYPALLDFHYYRGRLYFEKGDSTKALEEFLKVQNNKPPLPDINYYLGMCYFKTANKEKAGFHLAKAQKENPHDPELKGILEQVRPSEVERYKILLQSLGK